jgi:hypothetical protein
MLKRLASGNWSARHTGPALGTVEVTAPSREEALAKLRHELRYRVELCPCGGVPDDYVELQVSGDPVPAAWTAGTGGRCGPGCQSAESDRE